MIMDEFDHYFRLCVDRELSQEETRALVLIVSKFTDLNPIDEDVVMVFHLDEEGNHCYDVSLDSDPTEEQGNQIFMALEELFPDEDFECETSIDTVSEQHYLNRALLETLSKKLS